MDITHVTVTMMCDADTIHDKHATAAKFTKHSYEECVQQAVKDGWQVTQNGDDGTYTHICPKCFTHYKVRVRMLNAARIIFDMPTYNTNGFVLHEEIASDMRRALEESGLKVVVDASWTVGMENEE